MKKNNISDKKIEQERYDAFAMNNQDSFESMHYSNFPKFIQTPYKFFHELITESFNENSNVLEIGSGMGQYTKLLLDTGAKVTATDISQESINILKKRFERHFKGFSAGMEDIERLSFDDSKFDFVISAGVLSYGDNSQVLKEIHRVLKDNGVFICVDSLNHNPIYRFNRYLHFLRKMRSKSTLRNMPTIGLIKKYEQSFKKLDSYYFGKFIWLMPLAEKIIGEESSVTLSRFLDKFTPDFLAFKFVLIARK